MAYHLEGRLLEVCNCRVLCPCWIGEDPDFETCDTIVAWHFDKGTVDGVDVSGRTLAMIAHVPGNILQGNWTAAVYLDDKVSPAAGAGAAGRLHRPERRACRGPRQARRQGGVRAEGADHVRSAAAATARSRSATPATPSSSPTRARRARRRRSPTRCSRPSPARRCSSVRRRNTGPRTTRAWARTSTSRATTRCRARSSSTHDVICRRRRAPVSQVPGPKWPSKMHGRACRQARDRPARACWRLLLAALAAMAWTALWLWSLSPWSRYLGDGGWGDAGALAALVSRHSAGRHRRAGGSACDRLGR